MVAANVKTNALDSYGTRSPSKKNPISAMRAANALYGLKKVSLAEFSGQPAKEDLHVVVRTDTNQAIGAVGNSYECFDNESFFAPTAEALVASGAQIDRFQLLDGGTRAFMRLSWPDDQNLVIGKPKVGDIVGRRATLSTSHDGKWAGKFSMMMLRLACSNGMTIPIGCYDETLIHSSGGHTRLKDLQKLAPKIEEFVSQFEKASNILVDTPIKPSDPRCLEIVQRMVGPKKAAGSLKSGGENRASERVNRVMQLFDGEQPESDNRSIKNTGWGLYQAGVHYFTHEQGTRGEDERQQRFKAQLPGGSANREIIKAWSAVTEGLGVDEQIAAAVKN